MYQQFYLWTCRQANYESMSQKKPNISGREDVEVAAGTPLPLPDYTTARTHTQTHTPCLAGQDEASCTQCQALWSQASPAGLSGSYSGVGRCGWLVCNSSSVSDTVQVCPLWPRLPGDCVNSSANLRKYPVGIFVKPASATGLIFHLETVRLTVEGGQYIYYHYPCYLDCLNTCLCR